MLLLVITGDRLLRNRLVMNAEPYHQRVRQEAAKVPFHFADWLGVDVPVPQGAVNLLKPNVIISRRFEQMSTGHYVTVLLVQCRDARDILGHFPPVCYPAQGWTLVSSQSRDWRVSDLEIHGTCYEFTTDKKLAESVTVDNFMLLPDGSTARDMDGVEIAAQDAQRKYFGVAQVQFVYGPGLSAADRAEIFKDFVRVLRPCIDTIMQRGGENQ